MKGVYKGEEGASGRKSSRSVVTTEKGRRGERKRRRGKDEGALRYDWGEARGFACDGGGGGEDKREAAEEEVGGETEER